MAIKISILILVCVSFRCVFCFGHSTDFPCAGFIPEAQSYVVTKGHFMTFRLTMPDSDTCPDELNSVLVGTNKKDAPNFQQKMLCQIRLINDGFTQADNCFYNPSSKTFTGVVAFHEIGEMILTIIGQYDNSSRSPPKANIPVKVIEATDFPETYCEDNNAILFSFIGCVVFLMIIIAILCGILLRRKVSAHTQPPPAPVPDENVIELQQLPATQGTRNRVSALSCNTDVYQEIRDDFLPESSTDADGYMRPRPWVLPSSSTKPKHRPLLRSDRRTIKSRSSSASYVNTPSTSYANTASGVTSTHATAPLQTSAMTGASVVPPQPNDVLEGTTGGYMPMGDVTGGYMRMTRPTTPASDTHSSPQSTQVASAVETPHVYANDG